MIYMDNKGDYSEILGPGDTYKLLGDDFSTVREIVNSEVKSGRGDIQAQSLGINKLYDMQKRELSGSKSANGNDNFKASVDSFDSTKKFIESVYSDGIEKDVAMTSFIADNFMDVNTGITSEVEILDEFQTENLNQMKKIIDNSDLNKYYSLDEGDLEDLSVLSSAPDTYKDSFEKLLENNIIYENLAEISLEDYEKNTNSVANSYRGLIEMENMVGGGSDTFSTKKLNLMEGLALEYSEDLEIGSALGVMDELQKNYEDYVNEIGQEIDLNNPANEEIYVSLKGLNDKISEDKTSITQKGFNEIQLELYAQEGKIDDVLELRQTFFEKMAEAGEGVDYDPSVSKATNAYVKGVVQVGHGIFSGGLHKDIVKLCGGFDDIKESASVLKQENAEYSQGIYGIQTLNNFGVSGETIDKWINGEMTEVETRNLVDQLLVKSDRAISSPIGSDLGAEFILDESIIGALNNYEFNKAEQELVFDFLGEVKEDAIKVYNSNLYEGDVKKLTGFKGVDYVSGQYEANNYLDVDRNIQSILFDNKLEGFEMNKAEQVLNFIDEGLSPAVMAISAVTGGIGGTFFSSATGWAGAALGLAENVVIDAAAGSILTYSGVDPNTQHGLAGATSMGVAVSTSLPRIGTAIARKIGKSVSKGASSLDNVQTKLVQYQRNIPESGLKDVRGKNLMIPKNEFDEWFGKGIRNKNGEPKVWYHGTNAEIERFDPTKNHKGTVFFTDNPEFAGLFTGRVGEGNPSIVPAYTNAKNVFDYENPEHLKFLQDKIIEGEGGFGDLSEKTKYYLERASLGDWAIIEVNLNHIKEAGFEGVYVSEFGNKNLGVFDAGNIKTIPEKINMENNLFGAFDELNYPGRINSLDEVNDFHKISEIRTAESLMLSNYDKELVSLNKQLQKQKELGISGPGTWTEELENKLKNLEKYKDDFYSWYTGNYNSETGKMTFYRYIDDYEGFDKVLSGESDLFPRGYMNYDSEEELLKALRENNLDLYVEIMEKYRGGEDVSNLIRNHYFGNTGASFKEDPILYWTVSGDTPNHPWWQSQKYRIKIEVDPDEVFRPGGLDKDNNLIGYNPRSRADGLLEWNTIGPVSKDNIVEIKNIGTGAIFSPSKPKEVFSPANRMTSEYYIDFMKKNGPELKQEINEMGIKNSEDLLGYINENSNNKYIKSLIENTFSEDHLNKIGVTKLAGSGYNNGNINIDPVQALVDSKLRGTNFADELAEHFKHEYSHLIFDNTESYAAYNKFVKHHNTVKSFEDPSRGYMLFDFDSQKEFSYKSDQPSVFQDVYQLDYDEFLADAIGNPEFARYLDDIPWNDHVDESVYDVVIDGLCDDLGLAKKNDRTVFRETLKLYLQEQQKLKGAQDFFWVKSVNEQGLIPSQVDYF